MPAFFKRNNSSVATVRWYKHEIVRELIYIFYIIFRYSSILSANAVQSQNAPQQPTMNDDLIPDYMNILGMIFSMCALMLRIKWAAWVAIYCSCISFANTKFNDDTKQIMSSFMLSISAVVMSYLQNPAPMTLPGSAWKYKIAFFSRWKYKYFNISLTCPTLKFWNALGLQRCS